MLAARLRPLRARAAARALCAIPNPLPPAVVPDETVLAHVSRGWAAFGDEDAIVDGSGARVTYAQLGGRIAAAAEALQAKGFKPGDRLGLHLPNCLDWVVGFHAAEALGGVISPSNPAYTASELAYQFNDSGSTFALSSRALEDTVSAAAGDSGVRDVTWVEDADSFTRAEGGDFGALLAAGLPSRPEDLLMLPYSSGTTGLPKGVMLSHRNVVANLVQINDSPSVNLGLQRGDALFCVLPAYHIYGLVVCLATSLRQGAKLVLAPSFDPVKFLETVQNERISFLPLVPPLVLFLAKHPLVDSYDLSSVKTIFSGAAPMDDKLQAAVAERVGAARQGYGLSECSPVSHITPADNIVAGSVGVAVASMECLIVDEQDRPVPQGEEGELLLRGPNVMQGYLNNPEATAATIRPDGYLRTGDVAYIGDDGMYRIVDRLKELIKVKGFQVAPAELEALLIADPRIADAAVIGVPDDRAGEVPKAFVVAAAGAELSEDDVKAVVAGTLSQHKHLHQVEFRSEIPKSAAGKILRRLLRS